MSPTAIGMIVWVLVALIVLILSPRFVRQHEHGVVFRFRRLAAVLDGPRFVLLIPFVDRLIRVDLRVDPTDDFGYYLRGIVYASLGRKSDAIANLGHYLSSLGPPDEATRQTVKRMIEELRAQGYLTTLRIGGRELASQRMVVGNIIIDKPTKSIMTGKKFILFGRRRIIPFSDVLHVRASSNTRTNPYGGDETYWETILELSGHNTVLIDGIAQQYPERLIIAESANKEAMVYLADEIKKYLGRE